MFRAPVVVVLLSFIYCTLYVYHGTSIVHSVGSSETNCRTATLEPSQRARRAFCPQRTSEREHTGTGPKVPVLQ